MTSGALAELISLQHFRLAYHFAFGYNDYKQHERIMHMKISPYISFNGTCTEAVAFYEKAFNVQAIIVRYSDAPPDAGYQTPEEAKNLVMHAQFELCGETVMLCDMPPEFPAKADGNIAIMLEFDDADTAKAAFDALKEGGEVDMELQETFWSKCFGSLTDKFGIAWNISIESPSV